MSPALYPTRLYWVGFSGFARLQGVEIKLERCPQFLPARLRAVDYAPGTVCQVMPEDAGPDGRWRDMEEEERHAALAWLKRLHGR